MTATATEITDLGGSNQMLKMKMVKMCVYIYRERELNEMNVSMKSWFVSGLRLGPTYEGIRDLCNLYFTHKIDGQRRGTLCYLILMVERKVIFFKPREIPKSLSMHAYLGLVEMATKPTISKTALSLIIMRAHSDFPPKP